MKTIWKYPFRVDDRFSIDMPKGAKVVHAQSQNLRTHIWALVDTEADIEKRWFRVYGTGAEIVGKIDWIDGPDSPELISFVCTFPMAGAQLIWHLFEEL